jgi:hypothetical protein
MRPKADLSSWFGGSDSSADNRALPVKNNGTGRGLSVQSLRTQLAGATTSQLPLTLWASASQSQGCGVRGFRRGVGTGRGRSRASAMAASSEMASPAA